MKGGSYHLCNVPAGQKKHPPSISAGDFTVLVFQVGVGLYTLDNRKGEVGVSKHPDISDPYSLNFQNSVLADFLGFFFSLGGIVKVENGR